jgi:hypothetical protein
MAIPHVCVQQSVVVQATVSRFLTELEYFCFFTILTCHISLVQHVLQDYEFKSRLSRCLWSRILCRIITANVVYSCCYSRQELIRY